MILIRVDFPAPLSPISPTISLRPTSKSICESACTRSNVISTRSRRTMWWKVLVSRAGAGGGECGIGKISPPPNVLACLELVTLVTSKPTEPARDGARAPRRVAAHRVRSFIGDVVVLQRAGDPHD